MSAQFHINATTCSKKTKMKEITEKANAKVYLAYMSAQRNGDAEYLVIMIMTMITITIMMMIMIMITITITITIMMMIMIMIMIMIMNMNMNMSMIIFYMIIHAFFYKNNEAQMWPKIKNNVRTIQAGIWNHKCKFYFS